MNKPSPSLYERVAQQHVSRFPGTYDGSVNAAALVVSSRQPSTAAKAALTASFRTLGYTSTSIGWAVCTDSSSASAETQQRPSDEPEGEGGYSTPVAFDAQAEKAKPNAAWLAGAASDVASQPTPPATPSSPKPGTDTMQPKDGDLFTLVEAICPLCVVSLDRDAATALSHDFNTPLPLEARTLLMGHACICFQDFDSLLSSEEGKHKAWALLKTLPKMP